MKKFPNSFFSGFMRGGHVQGIAIDEKDGYVYFSFTTVLIKFDFDGNVVGSVKGIVGHLGCITFDKDRRKIYGSLELKHDVIGQGIIDYTGCDISKEDAFYCVSFDCDKINRPNMDAEKDEIMKAVYLPDVVNDYNSIDEVSGEKHRYGCSGIDGIAYGAEFGGKAYKIMIAYGIYSNVTRKDNDNQIILQFDPNVFDDYAKPLNQNNPHHNGIKCEKRYFFFTGNTEYGIQNLEYDLFTQTYVATVYPGLKKEFPNYPLFFIDAKHKGEQRELHGRNGEMGIYLFPAVTKDGGLVFPWGQTGVYAFGDGRYAFSHGKISGNENGEFSAKVITYKLDKKQFVPIE